MIEDVSSRSLTLVGAAAIAVGLLGMAVVQGNRAATVAGGMDAHVHMMGADAGEGVAARPTTTVKPLSCEKLPNVPGHSITTALVEFPPNAYTPRHRHPGSVTAFVIKGALRSQKADRPSPTRWARPGSKRPARSIPSPRTPAPPRRPSCWRSSSRRTTAAR